MHLGIPVRNRAERDALARGLADPDVRAFVLLVGELSRLPDQAARERVLAYFTLAARDPQWNRRNQAPARPVENPVENPTQAVETTTGIAVPRRVEEP